MFPFHPNFLFQDEHLIMDDKVRRDILEAQEWNSLPRRVRDC